MATSLYENCFIRFSLFFRKEKEKERHICEFLAFTLCSSLFLADARMISKVSQRHNPKTVLLMCHQKVTKSEKKVTKSK